VSHEHESLTARVGRKLRRVQEFLTRDVWEALPSRRKERWLYRALRMGVLTWDGLVKTDVFTLSAALTFKIVFSLVPFLAVMLAFLKGFGGLSGLAQEAKVFIVKNVTGNLGEQISTQLDQFIENVNAAAIGVVGFIVLLYTSLSLLDTIEKTFNRIWGIKTPRALLRRFTVYWTILTVSPVALGAMLAMKTFVTSNRLYVWLGEHFPFMGKAILTVTPFLFAWVFFALIYVIVPNTRVRLGPAFVGAVVAGTAWNAMTGLYVWYNAQVMTSYTFYGSLGSIPIFLLWVYLSWIIVLFGAEVTFAAQHAETYRREMESIRVSSADRDRLALVVCLEAVRPFERGGEPPTAEAIAARLKAPSRVVHEVAYQLTARGILREVTALDAKDPALVPGRDPSTVTVRDVLLTLRSYGDPLSLPDGREAAAIYRLVNQAEEQAADLLGRVTLKELAAREEPPPAAPAAPA
jgi:membrane protein